MRLLFLLLLLANVAAFGYIRYAESRAGADTQIALLQINPEKMKLLTPGRKDHTAAVLPKSPPQPSRVCLEWGGFEPQEAAYAMAALAGLGLADKVAQHDAGMKGTTIVIRDPGDALAARIAGLQGGFPGTQLKATVCADALAAKKP